MRKLSAFAGLARGRYSRTGANWFACGSHELTALGDGAISGHGRVDVAAYHLFSSLFGATAQAPCRRRRGVARLKNLREILEASCDLHSRFPRTSHPACRRKPPFSCSAARPGRSAGAPRGWRWDREDCGGPQKRRSCTRVPPARHGTIGSYVRRTERSPCSERSFICSPVLRDQLHNNAKLLVARPF